MRECRREREEGKRERKRERDHKENTDKWGERLLCKKALLCVCVCVCVCVCACTGLHVSISCPLSTRREEQCDPDTNPW